MVLLIIAILKMSTTSAYPDIEEYYIYTPKPNYPIGVMSPVSSGREKY